MTGRVTLSAFVVLCILSAGLAASQRSGTLKGRIEDSKGKPIAGAEVRVMRHRDRSVKEAATDESGRYTFELEPDDYTLSFDAEGFQGGTLVQMQQVEEGKETTVKTIRLEKAKKTALVRGAVFDASGLSLASARVKLQRVPTDEETKEGKKIDTLTRDYITNSRGEFAFRLPALRARYQLTATLSGYRSETKVVDVHGSEAVPVAFSLEPIKK